MSSVSPSFPGYVENEEFQRPDRGSRVYFVTEDFYLDALIDPSIILDAAYDLSPDHHAFMRQFGPLSSLSAAEQQSRLEALDFLFHGYGYLPVTDPYSWGVRRATVISSRIREKLPKVFETFPDNGSHS